MGFTGGRSIAVSRNGPNAYVNFASGQEASYFERAPKVMAAVNVAPHDRDTRRVLSVAAVALLAIAWTGLVNFRRIVGAARAGDPFDARNAGRLRWVAASAALIPLVTEVAGRMIDRTLDVDPAVSVHRELIDFRERKA
jgi:hypothetical protein